MNLGWRWLLRSLLAVALLLPVLALSAESGKVVKVVDGDTIKVKIGSKTETVRLHDFRRTRATLWDGAGLSLKQAMTLGGWSAPKMYLGYVQDDEAALENAVKRSAGWQRKGQ